MAVGGADGAAERAAVLGDRLYGRDRRASTTRLQTASRIRSCRWLRDARRRTRKTGSSGAFGGEYAALKATCFTIPLLIPAGSARCGTPSNDPYETAFTTGQRNIFRQAFQKRADASLVKTAELHGAVHVEVHARCVQPDEHRRASMCRGMRYRRTRTTTTCRLPGRRFRRGRAMHRARARWRAASITARSGWGL